MNIVTPSMQCLKKMHVGYLSLCPLEITSTIMFDLIPGKEEGWRIQQRKREREDKDELPH